MSPNPNPGIVTSLQAFIPDSQSIMSMLAQKFGNLRVQVLVGFEAH